MMVISRVIRFFVQFLAIFDNENFPKSGHTDDQAQVPAKKDFAHNRFEPAPSEIESKGAYHLNHPHM